MAEHHTSLSWLWGDEVYADVRLHLSTEQLAVDNATPSTAVSSKSAAGGHHSNCAGAKTGSAAGARRSGRAKAARCNENSGPPAVAAPTPSAVCARTIRLHASVLASGSVYFKTRTAGAGGGGLLGNSSGLGLHAAGASGAGGGSGGAAAPALLYADAPTAAACTTDGAAPARWTLVEHVEEGELDAAEAVLRHSYTGLLGVDAGAAAQLTVEALLTMMVLADRWMMAPCVAHCCAELAQRPPTSHSIASINTILSGLRGSWCTLPSYQTAAAAASERLLQLLGDAEAVCGDLHCNGGGSGSDLDAQLLRLSLPSLIVLLRSDRLLARSENSVLAMAHLWVFGTACSADARAQVAACLRLCQLSTTYMFEVLPQLTFPELSPAQRDSLLLFAARPVSSALRRPQVQAHLRGEALPGLAAWYSTKPRAQWPAGQKAVGISWEVTPQALAADMRGNEQGIEGSRVFVNGFTVSLSLGFEDGAGAAAGVAEAAMPPGWHLANTVAVHLAGADVSLRAVEIHATCSIQVWRDGGSDVDSKEWHGLCSSGSDDSRVPSVGVHLHKLPTTSQLDAAGWGPYVVGGKVCMKGSILSCV